MTGKPSNEEIAATLERIADLLETQEANPFRVGAYREGAATIRSVPESVADVAAAGDVKVLRRLPHIGEALARLVIEIVQTGRSGLLSELEASVSPEDSLAHVPGVEKEGAKQIVSELGITSLEELELAAHDGRLEKLEGFGPDRLRTIQLSLAGLLSTAARRRTVQRLEAAEWDDEGAEARPSVDQLLEVDAEYREKAEAGRLRTIAPKRFNPEGEAWLPVLDVDRDGWHYTALYSNTARAHELGTTHDWVVIYYEREGHQHQATVLTATKGPLAGKRLVRGREPESRQHYGLPR
ncbi:MAG: helix-hairpin-helix domain-containing protein [Anaerolineae bacterium]